MPVRDVRSATGVWTVGDLSQGGVATLDLTVVATSWGVQQNRLVRTTSQPVDPNAANDTAMVELRGGSAATADMSVVNTGPADRRAGRHRHVHDCGDERWSIRCDGRHGQ